MSDTMKEIANGNPRGNRRRNYIINASFQWKYATMVAMTVFVLSSIMSSVLYAVLHQQARLRALSPETYVAEITLVILFAGLSFAALTATGVGIWSFVITHRMCGPLTVIGQYLRQLGRGSIPKTRPLRDKDEFKDFYAIFNDTLESLKDAKREELASLDEMRTLTLSVSGADELQSKKLLEDLLSRIDGMHCATSTYLGGEEPASTNQEQGNDSNSQEPVLNG